MVAPQERRCGESRWLAMTTRDNDQDLLSAGYWRQRAAETRAAINDVSHANRDILEQVAKSYEEMADMMASRTRVDACPQVGINTRKLPSSSSNLSRDLAKIKRCHG